MQYAWQTANNKYKSDIHISNFYLFLEFSSFFSIIYRYWLETLLLSSVNGNGWIGLTERSTNTKRLVSSVLFIRNFAWYYATSFERNNVFSMLYAMKQETFGRLVCALCVSWDFRVTQSREADDICALRRPLKLQTQSTCAMCVVWVQKKIQNIANRMRYKIPFRFMNSLTAIDSIYSRDWIVSRTHI